MGLQAEASQQPSIESSSHENLLNSLLEDFANSSWGLDIRPEQAACVMHGMTTRNRLSLPAGDSGVG